jgi:hypothetical protein
MVLISLTSRSELAPDRAVPIDVGLHRDRLIRVLHRLQHRRVETIAIVQDQEQVARLVRCAGETRQAVGERWRIDRHSALEAELRRFLRAGDDVHRDRGARHPDGPPFTAGADRDEHGRGPGPG